MKIKTIFKLSYLAIFVMLLLQSCAEEDSSFGKDLKVQTLPTEISYPEILNAREFVEIVSAAPFMNTNGQPVTLELVSIKKGEEMLDASYLNSVSILNYSTIETEAENKTDPNAPWIVKTNNLYEMGKISIAEGELFSNGEYFFTVSASAEINGAEETRVYEDALRLMIGPDLIDGIAYCPFNMNFVSGENTTSNPAELFGGNDDVRFELSTESEKLVIDGATGALSLNSSYTISATEVLKPIINVISNVSDEVMSFENMFTATISTTPVVLDKQADYFFFPTLRTTAKKNVGLGGEGYSRVFIEHKGVQAGDPEETSDWYITNALWRSHKKATTFLPPVPTPDAVKVRADAEVSGTTELQMPFWTIVNPSDTWIVMDPVNLALYEGCFNSKAVFWYNLFLNNKACYELDGSTPIGLEVYITNNYTGDTSSTDWTQVNDVLECEINDNGTIFAGTPYPGDQTGLNPDGLKDPTKNANNLWVRGELNLDDYKAEESFTIAFRVKTYFDTAPNCPVIGLAQISNLHFVASEK